MSLSGFDDSCTAPRKSIPPPRTALTLLNLLLTDLVLYGFFVPLIGAYLASVFAALVSANPTCEVVLVVCTTFTLMYAIFTLIGEVSFWKHLFAFESCYANILMVRDVINLIETIMCIFTLAATIETLVNQKKGMKPVYMDNETMFQLFQRKISGLFGTNPTSLVRASKQLNADELLMLDAGASYILCWAVLTSCVAKLIYFNTLNVYLRSIEIFMSMNPRFGDSDDDLTANESSASVLPDGRSSLSNPRCRMERDLACTAKKLLRRC